MVILYCSSCSNFDKPEPLAVDHSNQRLEIIHMDSASTPLKFTDVIDSIQIIPLESKQDNMIGTIDKVIFYNNQFYILDKSFSSLMQFDRSGKYLGAYGSMGQGRGRFSKIQDFLLDTSRKEVLILSNSTQASKFHYALQSHTFTNSEDANLYARNFAYFEGKCLYFLDNNINKVSGRYNLISIDTVSQKMQRAFPLFPGYQPEYAFSGFLTPTPTGILYNSPMSDTVFEIDDKGIYARYLIDLGSSTMPDSVRRNFNLFQKYALKYSAFQNNFIESAHFVALTITKGRLFVQAFYNRTSKKLYQIEPSDKSLGFGNLIGVPVGIIEDKKYVASIKASDLADLYRSDSTSAQAVNQYSPALAKLMPSIKSTDNPVLVIFQLKNM